MIDFILIVYALIAVSFPFIFQYLANRYNLKFLFILKEEKEDSSFSLLFALLFLMIIWPIMIPIGLIEEFGLLNKFFKWFHNLGKRKDESC